ncbi:MAG: hypothetical protein HGB22_01300 [Chlorobiaceae bacterium]|nr:hypothetical protein [Chlorobiaceae bacterium]
MSGNQTPPMMPATQAPKKKGPKVMATLFVVGLTGFLAILLWVNWQKPRVQPETLSPALTAIIQDMPGSSDAMIYVGMKDIRQSRFWKEAIPDSLKKAPFLTTGKKLDDLMNQNGIVLSEDLDTLLISFQRSGRKQQNYIGMAWGPFVRKAPAARLQAASIRSEEIGGHRAYEIDSTLWVCPMGPEKMAIASSSAMMGDFLRPSGHFLERDSVSAAMIRKTVYKSHLWFTLASPQWTSGALQSITSKNRDVKSVGNLDRLQQIAMSIRFDDGLKGQSEWVYKDKRAAFFASSFLWGTIELSKTAGTRTSEAAKTFLNYLKVHQNLESVIITADLPPTAFKKTVKGN